MMCIHCKADCRFKDRPYGHCPKCKREFAFEPRQGAKFTDAAFQRTIDHVSAAGKIAWGAEHLHYALQRRLVLKKRYFRFFTGLLLIVLLGAAAIGLQFPVGITFVIAFIGPVVVLFLFQSRIRSTLSEQEFRTMLDRWERVHGSPRGLIVRKPTTVPLQGSDPDLVDYSFDRAVICDRARTADLLIANNFHFENNCAVLAYKGYPERIFATVKAMLRRNPRLQVFVLHDATPEGCTLAYHLAHDSSWFKGDVLVIDVGLRPEHAQVIEDFRQSATGPVTAGQGIDATEAAWLSRQSVELAVILPEQVIKRLFRAVSTPISRANSQAYVQREGFLIDRQSFRVQASASDGGADSFG